MEEIIMGFLVILSAVVFYGYGRLSNYTSSSTVAAVEKYAAYKPYALIASQWVEEKLVDSLPENATKLEKSLFKLNNYLQKFNDIVIGQEGEAPSAKLIAAAKEWSIELAEELNYKNAAKEIADAAPDNLS